MSGVEPEFRTTSANQQATLRSSLLLVDLLVPVRDSFKVDLSTRVAVAIPIELTMAGGRWTFESKIDCASGSYGETCNVPYYRD